MVMTGMLVKQCSTMVELDLPLIRPSQLPRL